MFNHRLDIVGFTLVTNGTGFETEKSSFHYKTKFFLEKKWYIHDGLDKPTVQKCHRNQIPENYHVTYVIYGMQVPQ